LGFAFSDLGFEVERFKIWGWGFDLGFAHHWWGHGVSCNFQAHERNGGISCNTKSHMIAVIANISSQISINTVGNNSEYNLMNSSILLRTDQLSVRTH